MSRFVRKHALTLAVALGTALATIAAPAVAGGFTKKKALKLFYTKAQSDTKYELKGTPVAWSSIQGIPAGFADGTDDTGTPGWALTGNAGTTAGTNFVGTTDNVALDIKVNSARALRLEPGTSPNLIGGFAGNSVTSGALGATIGGGGASGNTNRVTDDSGTVGGGYNNQAGNDDGTTSNQPGATVGGGAGNTANGALATVGGGFGNNASHLEATVGGGVFNTASGMYTTVGGGFGNIANGSYATLPGGLNGRASLYGQMAHASGVFITAGDAQASEFVLRRDTTDATPSELFLDGSAARLTVGSGRRLSFEALVVGGTLAGASAGYRVTGLIENIGGTTALVGTPAVTILGEDMAAWDVAVSADDTNDALVFTVTGAAATIIRWVASVRTAEVVY